MKLFYTLLKALAVMLVMYMAIELIQQSNLSPHLSNSNFAKANSIKQKMGDDSRWSQTYFDDTTWNRAIKDSTGIFWTRAWVNLDSSKSHLEALAMHVEFLASYECYWDGTLIGSNGKVGQSHDEEKEGNLYKVIAIPDELASQGSHLVAFRASNQLANDRIRFWGIQIGDFDEITRGPLQFTVVVMIFAGIFLVIGLYYLSIYFIPYRKREHLIFGCLNLTVFVLISTEYLKFFYHYSYSFHYQRLEIIEWASLIFFALLLLFFHTSLQLPRKLGAMISAIIAIVFFFAIGMAELLFGIDVNLNHDSGLHAAALFTFSLATIVVFYAIFRKKAGSHEALMGVFPCLLIVFYYDLMLFLGFVNLVFFNLLSLSKQLKISRQEHQAIQLRSLKLESELLKKNIQPHFIMNTLTSIMEWIENDPKTSIKFIEALSAEFRILNEISRQQLIPVGKEIDLCKVHLEIMSYRKKVTYELNVEIGDLEHEIPPAIIHSLIENGISHGKPKEGRICFRIMSERRNRRQMYTVLSDATYRTNYDELIEGLGTSYIKARLEEAYGKDWHFSHGPGEEGWQTLIEVPH